MNIKYAIDPQTGLSWSIIGRRVAVPVKATQFMYKLEKRSAIQLPNVLKQLEVTNDLPTSLKNYHREFWGLRPLNMEKGE